MKKPKYLYLHLGPGGNAALERASIEHLSGEIEFWDQPKLEGASCTYRNLVDACAAKFDSENYRGVIGHSFGCNIAQSLVGITKRSLDDVILVSPIRDVSEGFAHLAKALGHEQVAEKHLEQVRRRQPSALQTPEESAAFWTTVQTILSTPHFYRAYWVDSRKLKEHEELLPKLPPLDATMWQMGLNDFFQHAEKLVTPPGRKLVFLGEKDPYSATTDTEKHAWEKRGYAVDVVSQSGHYPHIEADCLGTWLKK